MDYCIVSDEAGIGFLEKKVKEKMEDGWKPLGGVSVSINESQTFFCFRAFQAMVKEDRTG